MKFAVIVNAIYPIVQATKDGEMLQRIRRIKVGELAVESISEGLALRDLLAKHYRNAPHETQVDACGIIYLDKGKAYLSTDRLKDLRDELNEAAL